MPATKQFRALENGMLKQTIGFIGAGRMARALAGGMLRAGIVKAEQITAADAVPEAAEAFLRELPGTTIAAGNRQVAERCEIVVLSVKPQQVEAATAELAAATSDKLVVSILAGVRLAKLHERMPGARLIRVMPNTPALVGEGASAFALGPTATAADREAVEAVLGAVGRALPVDEKLLDAVTGLSGSGPAFVYVAIEALADGGVRMGLSREASLALAAQTVKGAAEMVLATGEHPGVLKDRVASPAGTTIAGLQALENGGFRAALIAAVEAATRRSLELGGG
jgi:pyrroline-5-carboxylate reductase